MSRLGTREEGLMYVAGSANNCHFFMAGYFMCSKPLLMYLLVSFADRRCYV